MNETTIKYKKLIQKCWTDPIFKTQLLNNPGEIMRQEGICLPETLKVTAIQNTNTHFTLVIPSAPSVITDQFLDALSADVEMLSPHFEALPDSTKS